MSQIRLPKFSLLNLCLLGLAGFILFLLSILEVPAFRVQDTLVADRGFFNAYNWSFEKQGPLTLNGQWDFCWGELLTPNEFDKLPPEKITSQNITDSWTKMGYPAKGVATYRLHIIKDSDDTSLAIVLPKIYSAFRIYTNNHLLFDSGHPSTKDYETTFTITPDIFYFDLLNVEDHYEKLDVVIQVANYEYIDGGFSGAPSLGHQTNIKLTKRISTSFRMFLLTTILLVSFLLLVLYFSKRSNKSVIYLFGAGVFFFINFLICTDSPFYLAFSQIPSSIMMKAYYIFLGFGFLFTFLFFYNYTQRKRSISYASYGIKLFYVLYGILVLVLPLQFIWFLGLLLSYANIITLTIVTAFILNDYITGINKNVLNIAGIMVLSISFFTSFHSPSLLLNYYLASGFILLCLIVQYDFLVGYFNTHLSLENLKESLEFEINRRTEQLTILNENLQEEVIARKEAEENLLLLSTTDHLTSIPNRLLGQNTLNTLFSMYKKYNQLFSVILLDIDDFKFLNDSFGHDVGDTILISVTTALTPLLRKSDLISRWGGEEFLILMPTCTLQNAVFDAEKFRKAVEELAFPQYRSITISLGVAQVLPTDTTATLLKRADNNLYLAKRMGKNRTSY